MEKIPATAGWLWIKEGFALYRKQPAEMSVLFVSYTAMILLTMMVPLVGPLLFIILIPAYSMTFMQACLHIEEGQRVHPGLVLTGFRSSSFRTLIKLGLLYLLAAALALFALVLMDGELLRQVLTRKIAFDSPELQQSSLPLSLQLSMFIYSLVSLPLWFAAPLVTWQKMSLGKAVFYSFFSVKHAFKAILFYAAAWLVIFNLLNNILLRIVMLIIGQQLAVILFLFPMFIVLTVTTYCSFYPMYTHIFGKPSESPPRTE